MISLGQKLTRLSAVALLAMAAFVPSNHAAQDSNTLEVNAQIQTSCEIVSTNDADFGVLVAGTATEYDNNARIRYACTNGIRGRLSLDGGSTNGDIFNRAMRSASGDTLNYQIYTNGNYNRIWGDGTGASRNPRSLPGRGMNRPRNRNVFVRILDSDVENANPGDYTDTVTVTFTF